MPRCNIAGIVSLCQVARSWTSAPTGVQ